MSTPHQPHYLSDDDDMALDPDTSMHSTASSTSDIDSIFTSPPDDVSTTPTSRHPSGQHPLPQQPQQPIPPQPRSQATLNAITSFRSILQDLTVEAQRQLQDQPRATQLALSAQTREVHRQYEGHGSESRLSWNLWEFLGAKEDVRHCNGGEEGEGGLVFWSHEEAMRRKPRGERAGFEMRAGTGGLSRGDDAVLKAVENMDLSNVKWVNVEDVIHPSVFEDTGTKADGSVKRHPNRGFRINGEIANGSTIDTSNLSSSGGPDMRFGSQTETYNPTAFYSSTNGRIGLNSNVFIDPAAVQKTIPSSTTHSSANKSPSVSYTNDPSSTEILRSLEFRPADIVFTFPSYTNFPGGAGNYLTHLNNIVKLHNVLANAMLRHHDNKYLSEDLNNPEDVERLQHGYVILRAGIGDLVRDRVKDLFSDANSNAWGLTGETRSFLKDVFEAKEIGTVIKSAKTEISGLPRKDTHLTYSESEHGMLHRKVPVLDENDNVVEYEVGEPVAGRGKLSAIEEAIVARATRVPNPGVQGWWEQRKTERLPVAAMRVWVAAREVERGGKARREGRYWGEEDEVEAEF